jgi:hypothetical protein
MMAEPASRRKKRPRLAFAVFGAMTLSLVGILVLAWLRPWSGGPETPASPEEGAALESQDSGSFSVPGGFDSDPLKVDVESGERHWLDLSMDAYLEPGVASAAYIAIHLGCTDSNGAEALSVSGTQNIRQNEHTTINMVGLFEAAHAGSAICRVKVNAPNGEAAASGNTVDIDSHLKMSAHSVQGGEATPRTSLPAVVEPGESEVLFADTLASVKGERLFRASATMHLTTCTIQNGSKDSSDGDFLCDASSLDKRGSRVSAALSQEMVASDGTECGEPRERRLDHLIDHHQHHYIFTIDGEYEEPAGCHGAPRFKITLKNDGPAPVVVHSNSTRAYAGVDE